LKRNKKDTYIDGFELEELEKKFLELGNRAQQEMNEAVHKGAKFLEPKVKAGIPLNSKNGVHLRNTVKIKRKGKSLNGRRGKNTIGYINAVITVGDKTARYSGHVELGTERIKERRYVRNVRDKYQKEVITIVKNEFYKRIGMI
jgi:HK97 gp10 family phage protein